MTVMVRIFAIALVLGGLSANALAEEGPCQEKNMKQKVACLNVLLGKARAQIVALEGDVKKAVAAAEKAQAAAAEAQSDAKDARKDAEAANKAAEKAEKAANDAVPNGAGVTLESTHSTNKCLWQPNEPGGGHDYVNAVNCSPELVWRLDVRKRP
jgi:ParB-like chromosome segregation protein Spo0J